MHGIYSKGPRQLKKPNNSWFDLKRAHGAWDGVHPQLFPKL